MRILIDEEGFLWEEVWDIIIKIVVYINYIIMVEVFEKWLIDMVKIFFLRIYIIIEEINRRFCSEMFECIGGDW